MNDQQQLDVARSALTNRHEEWLKRPREERIVHSTRSFVDHHRRTTEVTTKGLAKARRIISNHLSSLCDLVCRGEDNPHSQMVFGHFVDCSKEEARIELTALITLCCPTNTTRNAAHGSSTETPMNTTECYSKGG